MPPIRFSDHVEQRIVKRELDRDLVLVTVTQPEQIIEQPNGRFAHQLRTKISGRTYMMRVFVEHEPHEYLIVSAYLASRFNRYLEQ